uniref:Putative secreted peptide n=1 Tax=Anopheles braziliensis TaxID=58242 RepID=A0A2M3ZQ68_9DIPT
MAATGFSLCSSALLLISIPRACSVRRAASYTSRQVRCISNTYRFPNSVSSLNIDTIVPFRSRINCVVTMGRTVSHE